LFSNIDQRISICQKTYRYEQRFGLEKEVSFSFFADYRDKDGSQNLAIE
jgi:hypothetical protein